MKCIIAYLLFEIYIMQDKSISPISLLTGIARYTYI